MQHIINDLPDKVFKAIGMETDHRWRKWVKWIDSIDPKGKDGYAFNGNFVQDGTIEVEIDKPRLMLAAAETGSAKYRSYTYRFAVIQPDGAIEDTGIKTGGDKGWALRVRDAALLALNGLNKQTAPAVEIVEIGGDALNRLNELRQNSNLTTEEIVVAALRAYQIA